MACDIHGWIEFNYFGHNEKLNKEVGPYWYPAVDIGMIADRNYRMFARLFGVRNNFDYTPRFANRGFPEKDKFHAEDVRDKNFKQWEADGHSMTHVYYNEIQKWLEDGLYKYKDGSMLTEGWKQIFDMMKVLAETKGTQNVRLVVWFDN